MGRKKPVRVTVYVGPALAAAVQDEAEKWGLSFSAVLRRALILYFARAKETGKLVADPSVPTADRER